MLRHQAATHLQPVADKPLLVTKKRGRQIIGVGPTKFWQLCKSGAVETVRVGKSELVRVSSLERLAAGGVK